MGTWNWGPFDNDAAQDIVQEMAEGRFRMNQFRFDCENTPLDSERLQELIALAAVANGHRPPQLVDAGGGFSFSAKDRRWIRRELDRGLMNGDTELHDMWSEAGELQEWIDATDKAVGRTLR